MAAAAEDEQDAPRRRVPVALLIVGLVVIAGSALFVAFRPGPEIIEADDAAEGERLQATLVVRLGDEAVTDAAATIEVTNGTDRPAYYEGSECSGPSQPWIGPEGAAAGSGGAVRDLPLRERLIAAGSASRVITLYPSTDPDCDASDGVVAVDPHETVSFEYRSSIDPVDRSSALRAVAAITEVTRRGRELGRLRLVVPLEPVDGGRHMSVDQAVDVFLSDPEVVEFLADRDDGLLAHVAPEEDGWRISVSTDGGHLAADVGPDLQVRISG